MYITRFILIIGLSSLFHGFQLKNNFYKFTVEKVNVVELI